MQYMGVDDLENGGFLRFRPLVLRYCYILCKPEICIEHPVDSSPFLHSHVCLCGDTPPFCRNSCAMNIWKLTELACLAQVTTMYACRVCIFIMDHVV
ncbi:hypothetical protein POVWA2_060600 [Plasmodium ovale wallikeri]|uniref:Uncharacterized protein n=1 Tax=Plasmodium ovale wallikeri TaxID=864142 RepID=A0A1A9A1I5_PLAOA|nr:hypothetical protein POVWA1_061270 [Plasmodium ovale wallikeri]SBT50600.1 hypothetical protein POVWA2_060600 [Plasmodium ovale wallikeri]